MAALGYFAAKFLLVVLFNATVIWLMSRWLRAERSRFRDALATAGYLLLLNLALLPVTLSFTSAFEATKGALLAGLMMLSIVTLVVWMLITVWIIKRRMRATFWRATIIAFGSGVMVTLFTSFVPRLFVESFVAPTASMAPTLTCQHYTATCPTCGKTLILPDSTHHAHHSPPWAPVGICEQFHMLTLQELQGLTISKESLPDDRFLLDKTLKPSRWELAVFRHPEEPSTLYVKRLVGLPGEKVVIENGGVWINGEKLTPPPELQGLTYSVEHFKYASAERPFQLADDECFMLGDFTDRANDSRYWGAVKESEILGVVTVRYWPLSRWKVFR